MYRRPTLWTTPNWSCSDSARTVLDGQLQLLGEVLEPGVGRGLQDDRVPCQEDAPGFVPVAAVPAVPFRQLGQGCWRSR